MSVYLEAQEVCLAIWARHLDELINAANGGDVVGDKGLELGLQLNVVWLVSAGVWTWYGLVWYGLQRFIGRH